MSGCLPSRTTPQIALVEVIAQRFRVLGEPRRMKIVDRLRAGDTPVGDGSATRTKPGEAA